MKDPILVLPLAHADDAAIARHAVQAAHSRGALLIVLDVQAEGASDPDPALVSELAYTARGNSQRLALLCRQAERADLVAGIDDAARSHVVFHEGLADCLEAEATEPRSLALDLTLPARLAYLPTVRRHVAWLVRQRAGEDDAFPVEILVDELCLNAVENSPSDRSSYDLVVACEGDELTIEVTNVFDDRIDSARIMHRRLESFDDSGDYLGERGRGLFLIARIADGLEIRPLEPDRIRVSVVRRLGRQRTR